MIEVYKGGLGMKGNGDERQVPEVPPYFSGTTFANFVEAHRRQQPTRFDRSIMPSVAGGDQAKILKALRFFGLSDAEGLPTRAFAALETLDAEAMQRAWAQLLEKAYPFLFSGFSLDKATQSQLEERFREQGIAGDTVRKAVGFFITLARIAGVSLSPYFKPVRARAPRLPRSAPKAQPRVVRLSRSPRQSAASPMFEPQGAVAKTIAFRSGGTATLTVTADLFSLSAADRAALFGWIDAMANYEDAPDA